MPSRPEEAAASSRFLAGGVRPGVPLPVFRAPGETVVPGTVGTAPGKHPGPPAHQAHGGDEPLANPGLEGLGGQRAALVRAKTSGAAGQVLAISNWPCRRWSRSRPAGPIRSLTTRYQPSTMPGRPRWAASCPPPTATAQKSSSVRRVVRTAPPLRLHHLPRTLVLAFKITGPGRTKPLPAPGPGPQGETAPKTWPRTRHAAFTGPAAASRPGRAFPPSGRATAGMSARRPPGPRCGRIHPSRSGPGSPCRARLPGD
jgi:hypothetical protein